MRGLYAIYRKEIGHFFVSPIAYAVVGLFLFISGFFFNLYVQSALQESMQEMQGMGAPAFDAASQVLRVFLGLVALILLFLMPMLTMGIFADERKRGTMELLMTSPIREVDIVLGKFLASLTLFAAMLLPTADFRLVHVPSHFAGAAAPDNSGGVSRHFAFWRIAAGARRVPLVTHRESDYRRRAYLRVFLAPMGAGFRVARRRQHARPGLALFVGNQSF